MEADVWIGGQCSVYSHACLQQRGCGMTVGSMPLVGCSPCTAQRFTRRPAENGVSCGQCVMTTGLTSLMLPAAEVASLRARISLTSELRRRLHASKEGGRLSRSHEVQRYSDLGALEHSQVRAFTPQNLEDRVEYKSTLYTCGRALEYEV